MSNHNCLSCHNFTACKDPHKSVIFVCSRYKRTKQSSMQEADILSQALDLPFASFTPKKNLPKLSDPYELLGGFDVFETIKAVLNDKRIVSPDIKIPEGDFKEAPNFYTWCVSDEFLNQKPFVAQALIGTRLFSEYCPDCSDVEWVEHGWKVNDSLAKFVNKVALLEHGKCPHCQKTKRHFFKTGQLNPYYEIALSAGQRSGKSALVGMMGSYLTHRLIKLERPNEVYGVLKASVLQGTFVALTYAQAKDTLYDPFYGNLLDSPWFSAYHDMLDMVGNKHGEEVYKLKDTFVQYRHRNIAIYPAGPDKRVLRGRTRYMAGIDELGWFPNSAEAAKNIKMNANEVYIALERSLLTIRAAARDVIKRGFYNVPFAYFINISSPSSMRDKIMELVSKAQGSKRILGLNEPTWRMNPKVPKSALAEEFKKDPIAAMRDYGAQPPLTNSPFIASPEKIEAVFSKRKNSLKLTYKYLKARDKSNSELYAELADITRSGKRSCLALDAGYSGNSFAFAVGHLSPNGYPTISVVGEVMPQPGIRINHSKMYSELLTDIITHRNIVFACADRWNSLKVLADMEQEFGIVKQQYSLKYADMQLFKSYIEDKQVQLPLPTKPVKEILEYIHSDYPECFKKTPADHLVLQLLTVQDTGSAVIKGDELTDDIARAVMLCFRMLIDEANAELFSGPEEAVTQQYDVSTMIVSRNYSGGGSSKNSGGGGQASSIGILRQRGG